MHQSAYDLLIAITYAINNKNSRNKAVKKAHDLSEILKIKIHLAKQITNLNFKILASFVIDISRQCKAWQLNFNNRNAVRLVRFGV